MRRVGARARGAGGRRAPGRWGRRVLLLVLLVSALMVVPVTARAVTVTPTTDGGGGGRVSVCGTRTAGTAADLLPVNRWSESTTGFHSRLSADVWGDLAEKVERNMRNSGLMQIGNASWMLSTDALYASSTFCPIESLGYHLDNLVGTVGRALSSAGLLVGLAAATVVSAVASSRRGLGGAYVVRQTLKTGVVLGLLTSMVAGGAVSTQAGPGRGSPWWWVQQANGVVNSVSGALASTVVRSTGSLAGYQALSSEAGTAAEWPVSCTTVEGSVGYVDYLHGLYDASYAQDGSPTARAAALPEMVSTMWEGGVLPVWAASQFGSSNPYTDHVYCFFLEARAHSTVSSNEELAGYVGARTGTGAQAGATWLTASWSQAAKGGNHEDQALLGWAACTPVGVDDATPRGDWATTISKKIDAGDCKRWWAGGDKNLDGSSLDWDENSVATNAKGSDAVYNYVASVHGKDGSGTGAIMAAYLVGSVADGAVLLLLAMLQLGSKLVVAFMVLGLFAALVRLLGPGDNWQVVRRTGLQLVGSLFVSSCAGLMIAVIMTVATAISKIGSQTFSPGTTGAVVSTCLGPVVGTFLLHWLFTAVLHVPSPFTVKGALAWGQGATSGTLGATALAGLGGLAATARSGAHRLRRLQHLHDTDPDPQGAGPSRLHPPVRHRAAQRPREQAPRGAGTGPGRTRGTA